MFPKLYITHPNPEVVQRLFEHAMNIACVCARSGNLPDDDDRQRPVETGNYWFQEGTIVHLNGRTNNYFAHLERQNRQEIIVRLDCRPSLNRPNWAEAVTQAIAQSLDRDHCVILTA